MARKSSYKKWFIEAAYDLRIGQATYDWPDRSLKRCGFFAQQCIEKSLKGFLIFHGKTAPKIHDLGQLAELAIAIDNSLNSTLKNVEELNPFYIAARYPDAIDDEVFKNIEKKMKGYLLLAKTVFDTLNARVGT